jgi:hypothetical protein
MGSQPFEGEIDIDQGFPAYADHPNFAVTGQFIEF